MSGLPVTEYQLEGKGVDYLLEREWLVTNGLGGYAAGTLSGTNTRRYHGLLVAATEPPAGRRVRLANLIEEVVVGDTRYDLSTHEYRDGTLHPRGWESLRSFRLVGNRPEFVFRFGDLEIVKTAWMDRGANRTWLRYRVEGGGEVGAADSAADHGSGFPTPRRGRRGWGNSRWMEPASGSGSGGMGAGC